MYIFEPLRGGGFNLEIKGEERVLDFVSRVHERAVREGLSNSNYSYFDDVKIIYGGNYLNTPSTEYVLMNALDSKYKFSHITCLFLVYKESSSPNNDKLSMPLLRHKKAITTVFTGINWSDTDHRGNLLQFRTALHSYCDRILRKKLDQANSTELEALISIFGKIIQEEEAMEVKTYFSDLLESVSNVYALFQKSYRALLQQVENTIRLLPAPIQCSSTNYKVIFNEKTYSFGSLGILASHSGYFDIMQNYQDISQLPPSGNTGAANQYQINSVPEDIKPEALHHALRYLEGQPISIAYLSQSPLDLQHAAIYLGIPRLVLLCEKCLIEKLECGEIDKETINLERVKVEMPHFYQALEISKSA